MPTVTTRTCFIAAAGVSKGFGPDKVKLSISMVGSEVFKSAVTTLSKAVDEALAANGLDRSAIDWLVPHQANLRIIQGYRQEAEIADGARRADRARPWQHVRSIGTSRPR